MINQEKLQPYTHLEFLAGQVVEGFITGLHKSPFHGFSVEFAEHRLYNKGESSRHIDWKLFGRTDKLFVKRYEEETNLRCQIIIDNSSSMHFPYDKTGKTENKIYFSVHAAAAIIQLLRTQRDAVGLSIFSEQVDMHSQCKSNIVHHKFLFNELEKLMQLQSPDVHKKTFAVEALHEIAEAIHKRSLVVIFSDMMDSRDGQEDLFSALQHLRHNKHEVILFHVTDKKHEQDFEFDNKPYQFIDMETGEEVKVQPNDVKDAYINAMSSYKKELLLKCAQYRIDLVEADINLGVEQILTPYLLKRQRMF